MSDERPLNNPADETDGDEFSSDCPSDYVFSENSDEFGGESEFESDVDSERDFNDAFTDISVSSMPSMSHMSTSIPATSYHDYVPSFSTGRKHPTVCPKYRSLRGPTSMCVHCKAMMWDRERVNKGKNSITQFSLCCGK